MPASFAMTMVGALRPCFKMTSVAASRIALLFSRLADPIKLYFVLGLMTGHESTWLPEALELLRDELLRRSRQPTRCGFCRPSWRQDQPGYCRPHLSRQRRSFTPILHRLMQAGSRLELKPRLLSWLLLCHRLNAQLWVIVPHVADRNLKWQFRAKPGSVSGKV
jgi:hypothetical protein